MIYYRYLSEVRFAWDFLLNKRLRVSKPSQVNDPYDCLLYVSDSFIKTRLYDLLRSNDLSQIEQPLRDQIKTLSMNEKRWGEFIQKVQKSYNECHDLLIAMSDSCYRFLSFVSSEELSADSDSLMWAHYANSHKGIRLGFKISPDKASFAFARMQYKNTPTLFDGTPESLKERLSQKSVTWKYENEVRLFFLCNKCKSNINPQDPQGDYVIFDDALMNSICLKSIDFGCRCPTHEVIQTQALLYNARTQFHVKLNKIKLAGPNFALTNETIPL